MFKFRFLRKYSTPACEQRQGVFNPSASYLCWTSKCEVFLDLFTMDYALITTDNNLD